MEHSSGQAYRTLTYSVLTEAWLHGCPVYILCCLAASLTLEGLAELLSSLFSGLSTFACHPVRAQPLSLQAPLKPQHLQHVLATVPVFLLSVLFSSQDPTNLDKFNVSNFFHVKNNMKVIDPGMDNHGCREESMGASRASLSFGGSDCGSRVASH